MNFKVTTTLVFIMLAVVAGSVTGVPYFLSMTSLSTTTVLYISVGINSVILYLWQWIMNRIRHNAFRKELEQVMTIPIIEVETQRLAILQQHKKDLMAYDNAWKDALHNLFPEIKIKQ